MSTCRWLSAAALLGASLYAGSAQAGVQRTFVASTGLDTNPCTVAAPCRTLAFALTQTNAAGEIYVLDSAGYGPVTITQAVSIVNQTSTAGVTASSPGSSAVTINAGTTDKIVLRGLTIVGGGTAFEGITFNSGGSLTVEDCDISGFAGVGIQFQPTNPSELYVSDTRVSNTQIAGNNVVPQMPSGSGMVKATFERVEGREDAAGGFFIDGRSSGTGVSIVATVADSVAAFNPVQGIVAISASGHAPVTTMVRNTTVSNNGTGVFVGAQATLYLAHSTVSGNTTALSNGGTLSSYGDNNIDGNGSFGSSPGSVSTR